MVRRFSPWNTSRDSLCRRFHYLKQTAPELTTAGDYFQLALQREQAATAAVETDEADAVCCLNDVTDVRRGLSGGQPKRSGPQRRVKWILDEIDRLPGTVKRAGPLADQ